MKESADTCSAQGLATRHGVATRSGYWMSAVSGWAATHPNQNARCAGNLRNRRPTAALAFAQHLSILAARCFSASEGRLSARKDRKFGRPFVAAVSP
jgi:hypothetical protein